MLKRIDVLRYHGSAGAGAGRAVGWSSYSTPGVLETGSGSYLARELRRSSLGDLTTETEQSRTSLSPNQRRKG
jgi:hypothetical protein